MSTAAGLRPTGTRAPISAVSPISMTYHPNTQQYTITGTREQIARALQFGPVEIERVELGTPPPGAGTATAKRTMSAATRRKLQLAARKRWAEKTKTAGGIGEAVPAVTRARKTASNPKVTAAGA